MNGVVFRLELSRSRTLVFWLAMTLGVAFAAAGQSLPRGGQRRWWSRLLIAALHVAQPVEAGWARFRTRFEDIRIPDVLHRLRVQAVLEWRFVEILDIIHNYAAARCVEIADVLRETGDPAERSGKIEVGPGGQ